MNLVTHDQKIYLFRTEELPTLAFWLKIKGKEFHTIYLGWTDRLTYPEEMHYISHMIGTFKLH